MGGGLNGGVLAAKRGAEWSRCLVGLGCISPRAPLPTTYFPLPSLSALFQAVLHISPVAQLAQPVLEGFL